MLGTSCPPAHRKGRHLIMEAFRCPLSWWGHSFHIVGPWSGVSNGSPGKDPHRRSLGAETHQQPLARLSLWQVGSGFRAVLPLKVPPTQD